MHAVSSGSKTLKDALNEAMRDWVTNVDDTFYIIGTVAGPHPYPAMVRDFQAVIGRESREQMLAMTGRLPDLLLACVGGGSNAIGLFYPFLADEQVAICGVEAAGSGLDSGQHAGQPLTALAKGIVLGMDTGDLFQRRVRNQAMRDPQIDLGHDRELRFHQHVERTDNRSLGGVFHRHQAKVGMSRLHLGEHIGNTAQCHRVHRMSEVL